MKMRIKSEKQGAGSFTLIELMAGVWGFGSGEEGGVGHLDHRRGGLSDRGEGEGAGDQPHPWGARGDGDVRCSSPSRETEDCFRR